MQGSSDTTSSREKPHSLRPEVLDKHPVLDGQAILDERVVEKTFLNNTSVTEDTFQKNASYLSGLVEGRVLIVTYYSQNSPITDIQSTPADLTMQPKDDTHISWTEIRNFELRMSSEMNFEYQDTEVTSNLTSEGIVLPGFVPRIGDFFLYEVRNGKIGVFTISQIARLALGQETYHKINFTMEEYLDATKRDRLRKQSTVWYFDKTKFLVGNHAYLNTEGYIQQKDLQHIRREIIGNYMDRFYSQEFSSFVNPEGIFDPYVVEFWNKKIGIEDCRQRPVQLLIKVQNYHKTIWSVLTMNPIKNLKNVCKDYSTSTMVSTYWGANITALLGHKFITVGDEPRHDCGVSFDGDTPVAPSSSVLPRFHGTQFDDAIRNRAEKMWDVQRHAFYGEHLPHRQCAPHQHPLQHPDNCGYPDHHVCEHECHPHGHHCHSRPPYPIVSTDDLFNIWLRLTHRKTPKQGYPLPPEDYAKFRGYVLWYRQNHPGTLSAHELEVNFREKFRLGATAHLTPGDQDKLKRYIREYRSHYLPVLNDREIEFYWRKQMEIALEVKLSDDQKEVLKQIQELYRREHGKIPSDEYREIPYRGVPFTPEEMQRVRKVHEHIDFNSEHSGSLDEFPPVFIEQHPRPYHHLHCHSVCHDKCGAHVCEKDKNKTQEESPTYALSSAFYLGSMAMDPFEYLLYRVITNQEFQVADVVDAVSSYLDWDNELAFYRHLFAIYLIDKALYWLRFHS